MPGPPAIVARRVGCFLILNLKTFMRYFLKTAAFAGLLTLGLAACKKDETRLVAEPGAAPVLTASTANAGVLTLANSTATAITFNWTAYSVALSEGARAASPATYTLQLDKASGNFSAPKEISAGAVATGNVTRVLTVGELNTALLDLMLPFGQVAQVKVRLKTVAAGNQTPLYSEVKTFSATPYNACIPPGNFDWGVVGPAADGWPGPPTTDRSMPYVCGGVNAYEFRTALTAGEFKFRADRAWAVNLGAATGAVTAVSPGTPLPMSPGGGNFSIATAGVYTIRLAVTLNAMGAVTGGTVTITP